MVAHDVRSFHPAQVALQGVTLGMARAEIDYLFCTPRLDGEGAPLAAPLAATREVHVVRARARVRVRVLELADLNPKPHPKPKPKPNPNPNPKGSTARSRSVSSDPNANSNANANP